MEKKYRNIRGEFDESNVPMDQTVEDKSKWKDNCLPHIKEGMSEEEREMASEKLGPNWASVMSGCGDQ